MKIPRPLLAFLALLIGTAIWYFGFRSSEEDIIREKLEELSNTISNSSSEGLLGKAKLISTFQDLLANPVVLESRYPNAQGVRSPKELAIGYLGLIQSGQTVDLQFRSPSISFPNEKEARVKTTVEATLTRSSGTKQNESQTLYITLGKDSEGNWKFERFSQEI
ncbi:hypothetical protein [Puniceicoccus vermicola]|uniref:DUF4440 domain-containing protein n=1 Tax=Puniceicoccus vermicola TaxID=388746 RepID=A0A7X1B1Y0_9BACT|nr:hypothetical protein [Puniceicoccus vermicola]MBC2604135.1 hypothetical protein [Puniceicoccus vermicola]